MTIGQYFLTYCDTGEGFDEQSFGLITKACSTDVSTRRGQLQSIAAHLGDAVTRNPPRAAAEEATNWERTRTCKGSVPEDILSAFPIAWSYRCLGDDVYGLSRARHAGYDAIGRMGNCAVHALVFPPSVLAAYAHNPVSVCSATAYTPEKPIERGVMPSLDQLHGAARTPCATNLLTKSLWRSLLPRLLSSLLNASAFDRPVILVLSDWKEGLPVVGALLQLMPRGMRARFPFITYEFNPRLRMPGPDGVGGDGRRAEHDLIVVCPPSSSETGASPDSLSGFMVFNLVSGEISSDSTASKYGEFAARCLFEGLLLELDRHHDLAARLKCDRNPGACDALVSLVETPPASAPEVTLEFKLGVLLPWMEKPEQAVAAFALIRPELTLVAEARQPQRLGPVVTKVAKLSDQLGKPAPGRALPDPMAQLQNWAKAALAAGCPQSAGQLLDCCGGWRDAILPEILPGTIAATKASEPVPADRLTHLIDLLTDGLVLAVKRTPASPAAAGCGIADLLPALFTLLPKTDSRVNEGAWQKIQQPVLEPFFGDQTDARRVHLLKRLADMAPPEVCPAAAAWLSGRLIQRATNLDEESLVQRLETMARACRSHRDPDAVIRQALELAALRLKEPQSLALTVGRMAALCRGMTVAETTYQDYCRRKKHKRVDGETLDRQLVEAGATTIVCRAFLEALRPWSVPDSPKVVRDWLNRSCFRGVPMVNHLAALAAERFTDLTHQRVALELAGFLIDQARGSTKAEQGVADLASQAIRTLPIASLPSEWRKRLFPALPGLADNARRRLAIFEFVEQIHDESRKPHWTILRLPLSSPVWTQDVPLLKSADKDELIRCILEPISRVGLQTPDEVAGLLRVLADLGQGQAETLAAHLAGFLRDRDPVTCVNLIVALMHCGASDSLKPDTCGRLVEKLLRLLPNKRANHRQLLVEHLNRGLPRLDPQSARRLDDVRAAAHLPPPPPPPAPRKMGVFGKVFGVFRRRSRS